MSASKWFAFAAVVALAVPVARAGDRTRVQITIAPYWGLGWPIYRPGPRVYRHGYYDGYRHSRYDRDYGSPYGSHYGGPTIRFDYGHRDRDRDYRPHGYRPGGDLRYDSRRHRDYYRGDRRD